MNCINLRGHVSESLNETELHFQDWCSVVWGGLMLLAIHSGLARLQLASKLTKGGVYLPAVGDNRAHRLLPAALAFQPH